MSLQILLMVTNQMLANFIDKQTCAMWFVLAIQYTLQPRIGRLPGGQLLQRFDEQKKVPQSIPKQFTNWKATGYTKHLEAVRKWVWYNMASMFPINSQIAFKESDHHVGKCDSVIRDLGSGPLYLEPNSGQNGWNTLCGPLCLEIAQHGHHEILASL